MTSPANPRTPEQIRSDLLRRHERQNQHARAAYTTIASALRGETDLVSSLLQILFFLLAGLAVLLFIGGILSRLEAGIVAGGAGGGDDFCHDWLQIVCHANSKCRSRFHPIHQHR